MKVACAASALLLLPALGFGFAPASSKPPLKTTSSLEMSFIRNIFCDRSDTEEEEKKTIVNRFGKSIIKGIKGGVEVLEGPEEEDEKKHYQNKVGGNFDFLPTKEMTGVDIHVTRLCATMSKQAYELTDGLKDKFMLNTDDHKTEVIIEELQDIFQPTNPNFGACISGETMILCWRGTSPGKSPLDLVNDVAYSPTSSIVWRKHAKTIKIQGAMASLCNNDVAIYEETIISACKKHGIKEIVTTGHSLGGGIGQIAHTILRAQIQDESSPWSELKGVNVRSVVFSAPMTTLFVDNFTEETEAFIDEIDENSCNLILSNDVIPRGYGYLSFINDYMEDVIPKLGPYLAGDKRMKSFLLKRLVEKVANAQAEKVLNSEVLTNQVSVLSNYIHPGKIVYYENAKAKPRILKDMGAFNKNSENKDTFRSVKYQPTKTPIDDFMNWHNDIVKAPGLAYDDSMIH